MCVCIQVEQTHTLYKGKYTDIGFYERVFLFCLPNNARKVHKNFIGRKYEHVNISSWMEWSGRLRGKGGLNHENNNTAHFTL